MNRRLVAGGVKEKMDHRKHLAMLVEQMRDEATPVPAREPAGVEGDGRFF